MSESKSEQKKQKNGDSSTAMGRVLFAALLAVAIVLIFRNLDKFWNILLVALGFGAVIMIHEFGHFIVAKLSGIKVEAFSIGFPPVLIGIKKTEKGLRFRILPKLFKHDAPQPEQTDEETKPEDQPEDGLMCYLGKSAKPSDTEYQVGMIPFGGFVKMLGQEDTGAAEVTDDPRSFANKSTFVRIAVVAAGVTFNAISAFLIFMVVFLVGMNLSPAVVGEVQLNSPADRAGIVAGDEIKEVNGETFVDFTNVVLAPALSGKGEEINFVVEHADGTTESIDIVAEKSAMAALPLRTLGIERASSLTIERGIKDPESIREMEETFGLMPGDVATSVNGNAVNQYWELEDQIERALVPQATISFDRTDKQTEKTETVDIELPLFWPAHHSNFETEYDLCSVYGMVPRIKVMAAVEKSKPKQWRDKIAALFGKGADQEKLPSLKSGDIIVRIGDTENPTYKELREVTTSYENKEMPITVLRKGKDGNDKLVTVNLTPEKMTGTDRVTFGILPELDAESAVVASTIEVDGLGAAPAIPRGAAVTALGGEEVASYYDIVRIIRANPGQKLNLEYAKDGQTGTAELTVAADIDQIGAVTELQAIVPFEYLKQQYKASGPVQAISWGLKKTYMFVAQTYVTLQRLITREVSPRALSGPVGIVSMSYKIASQSLPDYIYFLGLISSCIAVMNLLPLPIVDGGVIVMIIIEKLKGSPINPKLQEGISYAGLAFLGFVFIWLTYNDILNLFR